MKRINIEDYVEFLHQDYCPLSQLFAEDCKTYKITLVVGLKVKSTSYYLYRKFGTILTISKENEINDPNAFEKAKGRAIQAAEKTWNELADRKERWEIYEMPLFGYHFGMDYRLSDQDEIIGDWPVVAVLRVYCDACFLMRKDMTLPDEFSGLKLFPFIMPTGKIIA